MWTYDLRRSSTKRLTFDPAIETSPVWTPDGKQIVFASSRTHLFEIYLKNADGTEDEKLLPIAISDRSDKFPSDWSRDGKHIRYGRGSELWVADYPGLEARPFLRGPAIRNGQFSLDVRWVAYASNENGRWEIYVTSFPDARGKWQISNSGGTQPRWRADGKEIFYLASDGQLMAVPIIPGTNFDPGAPIPLFRTNSRELVATSEQGTYDVTKDGQHFLVDTRAKNAEVQPMTTILNWPSELKEP